MDLVLVNIFKSNHFNGRYWIRTSDPFRVKEVRYRCANRPHGNSLKHRWQPIGHHGY
jgi:hypothetical protein